MPDESSPDAEVTIVVSDVAEPASASVDADYTTDGVPTFESVRDKIETRYATSIGSVELAAETEEGRSVEEQYDARQKAAAERLAQIRRSMRTEPDTQ